MRYVFLEHTAKNGNSKSKFQQKFKESQTLKKDSDRTLDKQFGLAGY